MSDENPVADVVSEKVADVVRQEIDEDNDTGYPSAEEAVRVSDKHNVIGLDACDYPEEGYTYAGTYKIEYLRDALEIIEILGWDEVNVGAIQEPGESGTDDKLLTLTPDCERPYGADQASMAIAGRMNTKYADAHDNTGEDNE